MKYQAVIFDLFGTLTPVFSDQGYRDTLRTMARILGASGDDLVRWWFGSSSLRATGRIETIEAYLEHICSEMPVQPASGEYMSRRRAVTCCTASIETATRSPATS